MRLLGDQPLFTDGICQETKNAIPGYKDLRNPQFSDKILNDF